MPQMAPMSWMLIYMYFISIMMMFTLKIYFYKNYKILMKKEFSSKNDKIWKW